MHHGEKSSQYAKMNYVSVCMSVNIFSSCVCVCARARACVCVCVCVCNGHHVYTIISIKCQNIAWHYVLIVSKTVIYYQHADVCFWVCTSASVCV